MQSVGSMSKNKLIIAAAGSGKTTYLVNQARSIKEQNVLITTYTEANEEEIRKRFNGRIPSNITIQTWFSFLLQHGVRPYQSVLFDKKKKKKIGFYLTSNCSTKYKGTNGKTYSKNKATIHYYLKSNGKMKIYSDTIADFIININEEMKGEVISRIARIFPYIFIDEVQDLAGWELEIIKKLLESASRIILVGDPRQVTYLTHHPQKYTKYKDGKINDFLMKECVKNICEIDLKSLNKSHRNNQIICDYSTRLFPAYNKCEPCNCEMCHPKVDHEGVYLVRENDIQAYINQYPSATILKEKEAVYPEWNYGKSKGQTFERVLIYPTKDIEKWISDNTQKLAPSTRCKFYVAITRAKYSVAIVYNYSPEEEYDGIIKWK